MRLLLGVGGNEDALVALDRAVDRAAETGDELTVAILEDVDGGLDAAAVEARAREAVDAAPLPEGVSIRRLSGSPGPRLVELAEEEGFDRIVLGGGTRSPMGKISLGEVAEYVLLNARVSVTLVR